MKPKSAPLPGDADLQIDNTLAALARKHGYEPGGVEHATPLSALLAAEDDEMCVDERGHELTTAEVKREAWSAVLRWVFEKGADPRVAMRRLYALAHEVGPQHLRELTHEELALLLGDGAGRATSSARSQAIFGGLKSALGMVTEFGTGHKSTGAREKMSASAKGNTNRRGSAVAKPMADKLQSEVRGQIEQMPRQSIPRQSQRNVA